MKTVLGLTYDEILLIHHDNDYIKSLVEINILVDELDVLIRKLFNNI